MALEVRYTTIIDEGDNGYPKIYRVVYKDNEALSYSECSHKEALEADPSSIEDYFNKVSLYFRGVAEFMDAQTLAGTDVSIKMLEVMNFCIKYATENPMNIDRGQENE
jgi:hypothetical protein